MLWVPIVRLLCFEKFGVPLGWEANNKSLGVTLVLETTMLKTQSILVSAPSIPG